MKRAFIFLLVLLVTPALPGVAGAHVEISPTSAPAGKTVKLNFEVGHGCDGQATTGLDIKLPAGVEGATAKSIPGWKAANPEGGLRWTGGPLPDHDLQEFPFTAKFFGDKGSEVAFKLIQNCENGASTAWIQQTPASGVEPETPAPMVTLTSSVDMPAPDPLPAGGASGVTGSSVDQAASDVDREKEDDSKNLFIPAVIIGLLISTGVAYMIYRVVSKTE